MKDGPKHIFGGKSAWTSLDWVASDDRVRGGNSYSYLECYPSYARFHGYLDIKTLGGAGFASQRTASTERTWDLSAYDGIELVLSDADAKTYTFILKDEILPRNPEDGREQATISYEYDFRVGDKEAESRGTSAKTSIFIPWSALRPTYRGKERKDAPPINVKNIKRFSIMMRSFFGEQEGSFSLTLHSISAIRRGGSSSVKREQPLLSWIARWVAAAVPPVGRRTFALTAAVGLVWLVTRGLPRAARRL